MTDEKQFDTTYDEAEFEDFDHGDDEVSDGGIINTPREDWPEGWEYVEGESSPPTTDLGRANLAELQGENGGDA